MEFYDVPKDEVAPSRDERWENVFATVSPYVTEKDLVLIEGVTKFHIELDYAGRHYWNSQLASNNDLDLANLSIYKLLLDQMVDAIDQHIYEDSELPPWSQG